MTFEGMFESCSALVTSRPGYFPGMDTRELSSAETTEMRCGLPGPWQDLIPLMLGAPALRYVRWCHQPVPAELAEGESAGFAPARARRADTGLRDRAGAVLIPRVDPFRRRQYRAHASPRGQGWFTTYGVADRGTNLLSEPRELTEGEIADVYAYRPTAEGWGSTMRLSGSTSSAWCLRQGPIAVPIPSPSSL